MKNILFATAFFIVMMSCNNKNGTDASTTGDADTAGPRNPDGVVNSNVISTDTAAYRVDTSVKAKKDSIFKK